MSFILDALRKSESERHQDARPSITRIPETVPAQGLPSWALGTIAALALGVVVLAAAWWRTLETPPEAPAARGAAPAVEDTLVERQLALPQPLPGGAVARASVAAGGSGGRSAPGPSTALPGESPPPARAEGLASVADTGSRTSLLEAASRGAQPSRTVQQESAPASVPAVEPLPRSYASMASALGLPALRLELHSFSEDPAKRFVFINGKRYNEGETLSEGPRLIAVNREGAVLLASGTQLQLTPE